MFEFKSPNPDDREVDFESASAFPSSDLELSPEVGYVLLPGRYLLSEGAYLSVSAIQKILFDPQLIEDCETIVPESCTDAEAQEEEQRVEKMIVEAIGRGMRAAANETDQPLIVPYWGDSHSTMLVYLSAMEPPMISLDSNEDLFYQLDSLLAERESPAVVLTKRTLSEVNGLRHQLALSEFRAEECNDFERHVLALGFEEAFSVLEQDSGMAVGEWREYLHNKNPLLVESPSYFWGTMFLEGSWRVGNEPPARLEGVSGTELLNSLFVHHEGFRKNFSTLTACEFAAEKMMKAYGRADGVVEVLQALGHTVN